MQKQKTTTHFYPYPIRYGFEIYHDNTLLFARIPIYPTQQIAEEAAKVAIQVKLVLVDRENNKFVKLSSLDNPIVKVIDNSVSLTNESHKSKLSTYA